jgi:serine phosphatase RsbU (regulator of sigma subunit)
MFGFDRLEAAVKHGPHDSAANMMAHLQYELVEFVGEAELHDDLTIIVVKI